MLLKTIKILTNKNKRVRKLGLKDEEQGGEIRMPRNNNSNLNKNQKKLGNGSTDVEIGEVHDKPKKLKTRGVLKIGAIEEIEETEEKKIKTSNSAVIEEEDLIKNLKGLD